MRIIIQHRKRAHRSFGWVQLLPKTLPLAAAVLSISLASGQAWADGATGNAGGAGSTNVSTGITQGSIQGNGNMQADGTGIGVNGSTINRSNLNANQNSNTNLVQPINIMTPNYTGSRGGSAALILPRNPLALPNANLGRSNFGLQFGLQNNPGLSTLTGGKENGLGWFMQGGFTIPFGKIPAAYLSQNNALMDDLRRDRQDAQRQVFGRVNPQSGAAPRTDVQGRVIGLNAYNYSTVPADKLPLRQPSSSVGEIMMPQPKVLVLKPASAFSQPLMTGEQVGEVQVGKEYPYLGHTKSGWVKVLLPNGKEAWTSTQLEYLKFDYTEIDSLAVDPRAQSHTRTAKAPSDAAAKAVDKQAHHTDSRRGS
jgi:hypothetical protein